MKNHAITFVLILALLFALFAAGSALADNARDNLGKPMPDFSVTTADGERFTLSEELKTRKAVLVNFWATWCGPCVSEFPYMEEAYQLYKDRVAIIALSTEETDTPEVIKAFAEENGLSFPMASDTEAGIGELFVDGGIPTSVLVDRFGNVVMIEVGAQSRPDAFTNAFDVLLSDTYTESVIMNGFPGIKPDVAPVSDSQLGAAVGDPPFTVTSSDDPFAWPFLPGSADGKSCLKASNAGFASTVSEVLVEIDARAGDVFVFEAKLDTETFYEKLVLSLNGKKLRTFSGRADWFAYAVKLDEGKNVISLSYDTSLVYYTGDFDEDEYALLRAFRLLSGEEGAQALAANPVFSFADETALTVKNPGAREVAFTDDEGNDVLLQYYGTNTRGYIIYDNLAWCVGTISDQYDPDDILVTDSCTNTLLTPYVFQNRSMPVPLNSVEETGLCSTLVLMYNTLDSRIANLILFEDEESADEFCRRLENRGTHSGWSYIDSANDAAQDQLPESVSYTVRFTDPSGNPVPGCIINFCTDEMCVPVRSDGNGIAYFEGAPYEYHLQVIKVPEGHSFDTKQEFTAPLLGGEICFTVN